MHKKRIVKGQWGIPGITSTSTLFGSQDTSLGDQFSLNLLDYTTSNMFNTPSNGLGQNLLSVPTIGASQEPTWAQQQFTQRLNQQQAQFSQDLQNIIDSGDPTKKQGLDLSKYGITDVAQQFADMTAPIANQMKFKAGLALQSSEDSATQLLGRMEAQDAINEATKPLDFGIDTSNLKEVSLADKFSNSTFGKNFGAWSAGLGMANSVLTGILGEKSEYAGPKGDLTGGIDGAYDAIQQAAGSFGPIGQMVSLGMQANKMLGNVANKLGGGTDGMTTTDAIMGSAFLQLTPFGLINGFGGKKASTITKDDDIFETVGSSYTGTGSTVDDALTKSGKKYGLFSSGSREKANREIEEAKRQQQVMGEIADEATDRFAIRNSMSAINGNRRAFAMRGGYDQAAVRAGRYGMSLQTIQAAQRVVSCYKFQKGGKTIDPFEAYVSTLPKNQRDSANYRVRDYWELNGRPRDFQEALSKGMFSMEEDGYYHAPSVMYNDKTGEYEFMKAPNHDTIHFEEDWYNSDDPEAVQFRKEWELQKTKPYWKYVKRKPQGDAVGSFKEGGTLEEISLDNISNEYLDDVLEELSLDDIPVKYFQEGGKVNVIPEGALHARLHHMENAENLTKKGIPVVAEKEGGELEQQAEIEREEIIFRLEVTKKLEELMKKYTDDESSQKERDDAATEAGKLLTYEILNNTIDNTNTLL